MTKIKSFLSALVLVATFQALPSAAQDEVAAHAMPTGAWSASCVAFNQPAICETQWSIGLNETMTVQTYRIEHAETKKLLFEGRGIYRLKGEVVDGYWEDSADNIHKISGIWKDGILDVYWGELNNGGRSQYDFSSDELEVTDWIIQPSGWLQFMKVGYGRPQGG